MHQGTQGAERLRRVTDVGMDITGLALERSQLARGGKAKS
jgi:hypothetical protein